jgi:hypothetical protein
VSLEAAVAPILLATLALVDAGFSGFRDAAGRNPRIRKQGYFRRAVRRGLRCGLVSCGVVAALVVVLIARAPAPAEAFLTVSQAATSLVWSFGVYATLVLLALGVWLAAEPDLRALASVIILGPFTLIRPWWIATTCLWAAAAATTVEAAIAAIGAAVAQLLIEPWLARGWRAGMPRALVGPPRRAP